MMKKNICILFLLAALLPMSLYANTIEPTRYNWKNVANTITEGCTTDYERVKAIYRWICANISYDTSYTIYHADECWDNRRGVCQAYSELFYHIATALEIRVDVISGRSKDYSGDIGRHAWVYAETDKVRHAGVLIDPTWGAGNVDGRVFTRKENDMSWFHVDPYLMIFSHYPDDPSYQLLESPISYEEFFNLPCVKPTAELYGLDAEGLYYHCRNSDATLPKFYFTYDKVHFHIDEIPMVGILRPGATYRFSVRKLHDKFALICGDEFVYDTEWKYRGGIYTLDYTVPCNDDLKLSWYNTCDDKYHTIIEYKVTEPTAADLRNLEAKRPFEMPEIKRLKCINKSYLAEMGFDGRRLLQAVRNGSVTSLPDLYQKEVVTVVDVPLNGVLRAGQAYRFKIQPKVSGNWAIINNDEWHYEWVKSPSGNVLEIIVTPKPGKLRVSVQRKANDSYYTCLEYKVR